MGWTNLSVATALILGASVAHAGEPTPLFADDAPIRLTLKGPFMGIAADRDGPPQPATLELAGTAAERHAVTLAARGITRRQICQFPPLRLEFAEKPAAQSLFRGQKRLKLVTHCRSAENFQQYVLLEYAAYRLYNALTPMSFRARLATIDYIAADGKPVTTRQGFFIEDGDDAAKRNDLAEAKVGDRVRVDQLSAADAGRFAMFEFMIGNLDWAMNAGPAGEGCCHNSKLVGAGKTATSGLAPLPYDFDYSGLVDAPYAVPPAQVKVANVKVRRYRGFCRHNDAARAAAADFRARRPAVEAALTSVPGLEERVQRKASAYLAGFFEAVATDEGVEKVLKTCLG